jgi:hypothetical protein
MENFEDFKWGDNITVGVDTANGNSESTEVIIFKNGTKINHLPIQEYITLASRGSNSKNEQFKKSLEQLKEQIELIRAKNKINE